MRPRYRDIPIKARQTALSQDKIQSPGEYPAPSVRQPKQPVFYWKKIHNSSAAKDKRAAGKLISDPPPEIVHQVDKAPEQVKTVLRTGAGFGVVLHREDRQVFQPHPFVGAVEQRGMRRLDSVRQICRIDDEAVILAGDLDLAGHSVAHRVVGAAMAFSILRVCPPSASDSS